MLGGCTPLHSQITHNLPGSRAWCDKQVWVKVSEVRDEGGGPPKINCSMKTVSQEDGTDLDPGNTRGAARGRPGFQGPMTDAPPEVSALCLWPDH